VEAVQTTLPALPGVIAMIGTLMTFAIQLCVHGRVSHSHGQNARKDDNQNSAAGESDNVATEITPAELQRMTYFIFLLEGSILFHSIFVGIAISLATEGFWMFLAAFIFHQLFEGLGLGSRIAEVPFKHGSFRSWILVAGFALTAPIGQAIGLGFHASLSPDSDRFAVVNGTCNGLSSGMLLYVALVDLLYEDFLASGQLSKGRERNLAFGLVLVGAAAMAVISKWA
jgi:solute carrier family 39 (zinc transporter), member 1/2/3